MSNNSVPKTQDTEQLERLSRFLEFTDARKKQESASVSDAIAEAREQELHSIKVRRDEELHALDAEERVQTAYGAKLKNDSTELKIEMEKMKAVQQGLVAPIQDSVVQQPQPSDFDMKQFMQSKIDASPAKAIYELYSAKLGSMEKERAGTTTLVGGNQEKNALADYTQSALLDALKKMDTEKHLVNSPMGPLGALLGGIVNVGTLGIGKLGTQLFGGEATSEEKAITLMRAMSVVGPLARAELSDVFNRDKMEMTAAARLDAANLRPLRSFTSRDSASGADEIMGTAIDIDNMLANGVGTKDSFSSDSVNGVRDAYKSWDTLEAIKQQLVEANTPEALEQARMEATVASQVMRESLQRFVEN